ncbi:MAG: type I 3-dehydroquinate dehydratase [Nitrososphaerota archaeon]|nr:type I 3-dehydroquinate dehydratase [Nitrososphaerota archaeon]
MTKVVVSLTGNTLEEIYKKMSRASEGSIIELRLDSVKMLNPKDIPSYFASSMSRCIVTYRVPSEGGLSRDYRISTLIQILDATRDLKPFYLDIEADTYRKISQSVDLSGFNLLISTHFLFTKPADQDIDNAWADSREKAGAVKVVNSPTTMSEALNVLELYGKAEKGKLVAFSVGERYSFTRYMSVMLGSPLLYSHLKNEKVAEGQPEETEAYEFLEFVNKNWSSTA